MSDLKGIQNFKMVCLKHLNRTIFDSDTAISKSTKKKE